LFRFILESLLLTSCDRTRFSDSQGSDTMHPIAIYRPLPEWLLLSARVESRDHVQRYCAGLFATFHLTAEAYRVLCKIFVLNNYCFSFQLILLQVWPCQFPMILIMLYTLHCEENALNYMKVKSLLKVVSKRAPINLHRDLDHPKRRPLISSLNVPNQNFLSRTPRG
jgi:hypothetical protein